MFFKNPHQPNADSLAPADSPAALAKELHANYKGNYPLIWSLIGYEDENLAEVFKFFAAMRKLTAEAPSALSDLLFRRLVARYNGKAAPFPYELGDAIKKLSASQVQALRDLDKKGLLNSAFILFATGACHPQRRQYFVGAEAAAPAKEADRRIYPEPDNANFFLWAEFGFLAAYSGNDPDYWAEILRVLLFAERLFIRCYGQPLNARHREKITFNTYNLIGFDDFSRVHPDEFRLIPWSRSTRFDDLDAEATHCTYLAFPGGFK